MAMSRYYNPYTGNRSSELGSVWMYTSSIEAVNAAMKAMKTGKTKGETALYDSHFNRYKELLAQLYDNLEFYAGTFTLTSYTQTKQWTVYGVNRGNGKGAAQVKVPSMFTMTRCGWCVNCWNPIILLVNSAIWKRQST